MKDNRSECCANLLLIIAQIRFGLMISIMKLPAVLLILCITSSFAIAKETHATATWITSTANISSGEPLRSVVKMKINQGWHTYWKNPGEGGIPMKIEASLPEGWKIGEIQYPEPIRFKTGTLPSYGYEKEVLLPITITPPEIAEGPIPAIRATLSWLTCNDQSCVPGKAEIKLSHTADPEMIEAAYRNIPSPLPEADLSFEISGEKLKITLVLPAGSAINPASYEIFPVTQDIIDPASQLRFEPNQAKLNTWSLIANQSEYISDRPQSLTLELFKSGQRPWVLSSNGDN